MAVQTQTPTIGQYGQAADAIIGGGVFSALSGNQYGGQTSNPTQYGQGIVEWILVLVAVIALVVAYEADSKVGSALLVIIVLLMLYSAHARGIV